MLNLRTVILAAVILGVSSPTAWAVDVGDIPPDEIGTVDGEPVLLSDGHGKVRVVTFWASWCPPCIKELPVLAQIQAQVGTSDFQVYAINYKESRRTFKQLRKKLVETETGIIFLHDRKGFVGDQYGVKGIPHMVILDRDGTVAYRHVGYVDAIVDQLVVELNGLLTAAR